jgi:glyoxylase-like metal-dependent hydrolase (beta-lactamase superfamily II)
MSKYEVIVLKSGYAHWISPTQQRADGSITLVKGSRNVLVDTGGPWNREKLPVWLAEEGLAPNQVDFVICTHGHSDHVGNINLFPSATLILSHDICQADLYTVHDFASGQPFKVDDDVDIISTPGHAWQDISVIVRANHGIYAVVGDLFESEGDRDDESLWRSASEFPEQQEASRRSVLDLADFIVPGHGGMFRVRPDSAPTYR